MSKCGKNQQKKKQKNKKTGMIQPTIIHKKDLPKFKLW